jgi:PAS domain S-box-containing protein
MDSGPALSRQGPANATADIMEPEACRADLEDFFENGAVALHLVSGDGIILRANKAELELLGYAAQEYVGRHSAEFHADRHVLDDILERLKRGETLLKYPARLRARDGAIKLVEITSSGQFRDGTFINTRCFTVDVTERELARQELDRKDEQLRQVLDALQAAVYMTDAAGKITYVNRAAVELVGREPNIGQDEWCVTYRLFTPEGEELPPDERPLAIALREKRPVQAFEGLVQRPDGILCPLLLYPTPIRDSQGELIGAVNMLVEITERKEAEDRFRLAVEAAPNGMVLVDDEGRIVLMNGEAEKLFGYAREELLGEPVESLIPQRLRRNHAAYRKGFGQEPEVRAMGAGRELFALRKDGTEFPVEIGLSPIQTSKGLMVLAAIVDISERKRAETQRELLLAELNHRVKNTLAIVQGMAHQTFKDTQVAPEALRAFEGRLTALGAAHGLLSQAEWQEASLAQVAAEALQASAADETRVAFSGPQVLLPPREALAVSMALPELCTNALKYGALSNESGRVSLEWSTSEDPEPRLELVWRELGGPQVSPPKRRGFGLLMIEQALAQDLDGEVDLAFRPEGLVCTIHAPLSQARKARSE